MELSPSTRDTLIVVQPTAWVSVEGVLRSIGEKSAVFNWKDADRSIGREKIAAIRLTPLAEHAKSIGRIKLTDGTVLAVSEVAFDGKVWTVNTISLGKLQLPSAKVAGVKMHSDRVISLADLTPLEVKEYGMFDKVYHYKTHRSVGGGPLRLGAETYSAGLGLHSFCELTYALGGKYVRLVALAGIDRSVRPAGDATLSFLADGKLIGKPIRLQGKDEPTPIRVDLAGVKRLTIRVDFGQDKLDAADHVNLASPRLIAK
jgi:hypothetical protein